MIAVDTNILVYAHREELPQHATARDRLLALAQGSARWAIPVFCLGELLRVLSHPRLFDPPHTAAEAAEALRRVLAAPTLEVLLPGPRFPALLLEAMVEGRATGNLVFDAQIVALCREAGISRLLTEDRDFARFAGIEIIGLDARQPARRR